MTLLIFIHLLLLFCPLAKHHLLPPRGQLGKKNKQITDYSSTNSVFVSDGKLTPPKLTLRRSVNERMSEVLKECYNFDFDNYIKYHQPEHKCKEDISITIHFLEWFIGFAEGDGSFESRLAEGRPLFSFTIVQKDSQLLYKVKKGLAFGSVSKDRNFYRFRVDDKRGIQRLQSIFNGNLVLPKRRIQFENWISFKKKVQHSTFCLYNRSLMPTLKTAWLSGFIEAEGCFYVRLSKKTSGFRIADQKLTITQTDTHGERNILKHINNLFESKGNLNLAKSPNCFRIEICSLKCHKIVVEYFQHFGLKGKKHISYFRWWRIYLMRLDNGHLLEGNQKKLQRLCQNLNSSEY